MGMNIFSCYTNYIAIFPYKWFESNYNPPEVYKCTSFAKNSTVLGVIIKKRWEVAHISDIKLYLQFASVWIYLFIFQFEFKIATQKWILFPYLFSITIIFHMNYLCLLLIFLVGFVCFLFLKKIYLFFLAALGLCCCTQTFQSYSLAAVLGLLSRWQLLLLGSAGSRAFRGAHRLICSVACGIFWDQGSKLCPLHWQADS